MLRGFAPGDENHRNVPSKALLQSGIFVDVDLAQRGAKFAQQGRDSGLCLLAKMASRSCVQRDVARTAGREPRIFGRVARAHG